MRLTRLCSVNEAVRVNGMTHRIDFHKVRAALEESTKGIGIAVGDRSLSNCCGEPIASNLGEDRQPWEDKRADISLHSILTILEIKSAQLTGLVVEDLLCVHSSNRRMLESCDN